MRRILFNLIHNFIVLFGSFMSRTIHFFDHSYIKALEFQKCILCHNEIIQF